MESWEMKKFTLVKGFKSYQNDILLRSGIPIHYRAFKTISIHSAPLLSVRSPEPDSPSIALRIPRPVKYPSARRRQVKIWKQDELRFGMLREVLPGNGKLAVYRADRAKSAIVSLRWRTW
jgi:hypothetical protein